MTIKYEDLTSSISYFLVLMDDYEKASEFLFDMIDHSFSNPESSEEDIEDIKSFVMDIVTIISSFDSVYSERMAKKYYQLITEQK